MNRTLRRILRRCTYELARHGLISPYRSALLLHRFELDHKANLNNPRDFNEKILWMEYNTDTSMWSRLADKYAVRKFVEERGLENLLVPVYGLWENSEEIEFDALPEKFVIKPTDGFGQVILVGDKRKADIKKLRGEMAEWGKSNFARASGEPHYMRIPHRIVAEKLLQSAHEDGTGSGITPPPDYKFFCADGVPKYCEVCTGRNFKDFMARYTFFSLPDWQRMDGFVLEEHEEKGEVPLPRLREDMVRYAGILSRGFRFVRVDFYESEGRVYFGEMTFTPGGGRLPILTARGLRDLGAIIKL